MVNTAPTRTELCGLVDICHRKRFTGGLRDYLLFAAVGDTFLPARGGAILAKSPPKLVIRASSSSG